MSAPEASPREVIGIGGMALVRSGVGSIITHALGSCVGITLWCRRTHLGAMVHCQLPQSTTNPALAAQRPGIFVDTGLPLLLDELERCGAKRRELAICMAGGANVGGLGSDLFNIGAKNVTIARKILWQQRLLLRAEETGGTIPRTLQLNLQDGSVILSTGGVSRNLA